MSLVTINQRCGSSKERRKTSSGPDPETRDNQQKEVRSGTGRKDDDQTGFPRRKKTYPPLDEDRRTIEEQIEHSVNQTILRCQREADEEEEKRRRQAREELEGVSKSLEREMERRAQTSRGDGKGRRDDSRASTDDVA
jgi:hypothetical protein